MNNQDMINEFGSNILSLIEEYSKKLPPYEVGNQLIVQGVSMMLFTAPNELVGIKTALTSLNIGISLYEQKYS